MTTRSNIPEAVAKTLQTPYWGVLTLATYVLGASNNWLLLRYLKACFDEKNAVRLQDADGDATTTRRDVPPADILVVFVSWMRDFDFWRAEARKAMGLDLVKLQQQGRFTFIDGMTRPHSASESVDRKNHDPAGPSSPPPTARAPPPIPIASAPRRGGLYHLKDLSLGTLELAVQQSLETLHPTTQAILILDTPTLPISLQTKPSAHAFWNMLLSLRSQPRLHSAIISIPADDAFVEAAIGADPTNQKHSKTPLEVETAAFVSQCVSQADTIVSCRRLGTGWAKDVSGVLRVTRGGSADVEDGEDARDIEGRHFHHFKRSVEEGEWLYYVAGDGSVKVWARGSATV